MEPNQNERWGTFYLRTHCDDNWRILFSEKPKGLGKFLVERGFKYDPENQIPGKEFYTCHTNDSNLEITYEDTPNSADRMELLKPREDCLPIDDDINYDLRSITENDSYVGIASISRDHGEKGLSKALGFSVAIGHHFNGLPFHRAAGMFFMPLERVAEYRRLKD
tara:strand:- start:451 stop:945 length:495 start_codon:yes stop_codon:yes gene_type:complete